MREVTKEFIKDEEITIENIEKQLDKITIVISEHNKLNLTDINILCEEIFGKILNQLYDLNLKATSANKIGNFIAVDLIDEEARVAFQITSQRTRGKIENTIDKFNKSYHGNYFFRKKRKRIFFKNNQL